MSLLLAVDGGGSKTDVLVCDDTGAVLGYARGPGTNHQTHGLPEAMRRLDTLVTRTGLRSPRSTWPARTCRSS
jgi:N-acetylglucosamine kinase-like BadF-type ATPase